MLSLRLLLSAGALILGGVLVFQACGKQEEGMRCELLNGHEDCDPGLECSSRSCSNDTICCPKLGAKTTTSECACATAGPADAAGAETASTDAGTTDIGAETADGGSSETGADTAIEDAADGG
jgi:hypothetical protein